LEALAMTESRLLDGQLIDECAVGRIKVLHRDVITSAGDLAVKAGDGWMLDLDIVGAVAPDAAYAGLEVQLLRLPALAIEQQSSHA
jgi:hypothetical protein